MGTRGSGRIKRHFLGLSASVAAVAALALTATFTLGGFSGTINNNTSTFSSATVQLEEGNGATTCYTTGAGAGGSVGSSNTNAACGINDLVGTLDQVPGGAALTSTITLTDVGNHTPGSASLTIGSCTTAAASDASSYVGSDSAATYCGKVDVTISNSTTGHCMYPYSASAACPALSNTYTLATLATDVFANGAGTPSGTSQFGLSIPAASGGTAVYVVSSQLDATATNADQGTTATEAFTWAISQ